jgi:F0F1-type ATP synthase assembly protein I
MKRLIRFILSFLFLFLFLKSFSNNPAYLDGMPSVEKIKNNIKDKDDIVSLIKQYEAVDYCVDMINMAVRNHDGKQYPDEKLLIEKYNNTKDELLSEFHQKTHNQNSMKWKSLWNKYEDDTKFSNEVLSLLSPDTKTYILNSYNTLDENDKQTEKQNEEIEKQAKHKEMIEKGIVELLCGIMLIGIGFLWLKNSVLEKLPSLLIIIGFLVFCAGVYELWRLF